MLPFFKGNQKEVKENHRIAFGHNQLPQTSISSDDFPLFPNIDQLERDSVDNHGQGGAGGGGCGGLTPEVGGAGGTNI